MPLILAVLLNPRSCPLFHGWGLPFVVPPLGGILGVLPPKGGTTNGLCNLPVHGEVGLHWGRIPLKLLVSSEMGTDAYCSYFARFRVLCVRHFFRNSAFIGTY